MTGRSMTAYQEGYAAGERAGRIAARDAAIEECARLIESGAGMADLIDQDELDQQAKYIRALSIVTSTEQKKPEAEPEKMVFEPPVEKPYDRIANRVLAAVEEINNALDEAHKCAEMRVFLKLTKAPFEPMRFEPQIYRLTHTTLTYVVKMKDDNEMTWQRVKDPAFEDAAGQGLAALHKEDDVVATESENGNQR